MYGHRTRSHRPHYHEGATSTTPLLYPTSRSLPQHHYPAVDHTRSFFRPLYFADYITILLILTIGFYLDYIPEPFHRSFSLTDPSISRPLVAESVSRLQTWAIAVSGPVIAVLGVWIVRAIKFRIVNHDPDVEVGDMHNNWWKWIKARMPHDVHHALLGSMLALSLTHATTCALKLLVGRLRPDFLDRCAPDPLTLECTSDDISAIRIGRMSFPSGHAARTAAGLGFAFYYLLAVFGVLAFDRRRIDGRAWKLVLAILPLVGIAYVAISRLQQNRHHVEDVVVGTSMGLVIAFISYRFYYPSVVDKADVAGWPKRRNRDDDFDESPEGETLV